MAHLWTFDLQSSWDLLPLFQRIVSVLAGGAFHDHKCVLCMRFSSCSARYTVQSYMWSRGATDLSQQHLHMRSVASLLSLALSVRNTLNIPFTQRTEDLNWLLVECWACERMEGLSTWLGPAHMLEWHPLYPMFQKAHLQNFHLTHGAPPSMPDNESSARTLQNFQCATNLWDLILHTN